MGPDERARSQLLTDPARVCAVLQDRLPVLAGRGVTIVGCRILHTRYRTSTADRRHRRPFLSVGYELSLRDRRGAACGVQIVHARAYAAGDARGTRADGVVHLPDLGADVWSFPDDPRLGHLREVVDPDRVRRHLPYGRLPAGLATPARVREVIVQVVRYKPEVRCTSRYLLHGDGDHRERPFELYGKTFRHGRAAEMLRRMEAVHRHTAGRDRAFAVPRPLGCSQAVRTVWQEGLAGRPVLEVLERANHGPLIAAAARGLAELHAIRVPGLPRTTTAARLAAAGEEAAALAAAYPQLSGRLTGLVDALGRQQRRLVHVPDGLVHGDFLLKQLVAGDGRLGVFDFDGFAAGDPLQDLANFVVDEGRNLRCPGSDPPAPEAVARTFLDAYRGHADRDVPAGRLRWHASVQALRDAYYWHKRRHLDPAFGEELARLVALAEDPPIPE